MPDKNKNEGYEKTPQDETGKRRGAKKDSEAPSTHSLSNAARAKRPSLPPPIKPKPSKKAPETALAPEPRSTESKKDSEASSANSPTTPPSAKYLARMYREAAATSATPSSSRFKPTVFYSTKNPEINKIIQRLHSKNTGNTYSNAIIEHHYLGNDYTLNIQKNASMSQGGDTYSFDIYNSTGSLITKNKISTKISILIWDERDILAFLQSLEASMSIGQEEIVEDEASKSSYASSSASEDSGIFKFIPQDLDFAQNLIEKSRGDEQQGYQMECEFGIIVLFRKNGNLCFSVYDKQYNPETDYKEALEKLKKVAKDNGIEYRPKPPAEVSARSGSKAVADAFHGNPFLGNN